MNKPLEPKVGMYANEYLWSDVHPWEIIKINSKNKITIRSMKYERDPTFKPNISVGGFAGHCNNQHQQKWIIESDPNGAVREIRRRKNGRWGAYHKIEDYPYYFYDYNF